MAMISLGLEKCHIFNLIWFQKESQMFGAAQIKFLSCLWKQSQPGQLVNPQLSL